MIHRQRPSRESSSVKLLKGPGAAGPFLIAQEAVLECDIMAMLDEIVDGRTDLVFEYCATGNSATSSDKDGVSLLQWCAYYGDVSAMKFLLANGRTSLEFFAGKALLSILPTFNIGPRILELATY